MAGPRSFDFSGLGNSGGAKSGAGTTKAQRNQGGGTVALAERKIGFRRRTCATIAYYHLVSNRIQRYLSSLPPGKAIARTDSIVRTYLTADILRMDFEPQFLQPCDEAQRPTDLTRPADGSFI